MVCRRMTVLWPQNNMPTDKGHANPSDNLLQSSTWNLKHLFLGRHSEDTILYFQNINCYRALRVKFKKATIKKYNIV